MAQNTQPIFSKIPVVSTAVLTGNIANTKSDGQGTIDTDMFLVFTADSTDGSYVNKVRISGTAQTAATTMTATVIRLYLSTVSSGSTTAADTKLFAEISVAALVADHSTNATNFYEIPFNIALPPSMTILASIHANVAANSTWELLCFGGDYS